MNMDYNAEQLHRRQQTVPLQHRFKVGVLASAVSFLLLHSASVFASDIEIYTKPSDSVSSASVILMLDTSGSMDLTANNFGVGESACDLPAGVSNVTLRSGIDHPDGRGYKVNYCESTGKKYFFRKISECTSWSWRGRCTAYTDIWYSCGAEGSTSKSTSTCSTRLNTTPSVSGFTQEDGRRGDDSDYYYKNTESAIFYDRISRLKNALYDLATTPTYDAETSPNGIKENVNIGIGTYPYVSSSESNFRGYIRIPAAKWDAAQKLKVLEMIKSSSFRGTGGTPTSAAYAEAAAYLLGTTTGGGTYSGMGLAPTAIKQTTGTRTHYVSPLSSETASCSGQGIYFLTDGQPQTPYNTNTATLMANALKLASYTFTTGIPNNGNSDDGNFKSDWRAIGSFAQSLNDLSVVKAASGIDNLSRPVVTAVVGFGSGITGNDAANVQTWGLHEKNAGLYGRGGYIPASDSEDIVTSLNDFIEGVSGEIPSISTGSSTIPLDALNPEIIQPYSYFPQFEPKVDENAKQQLWFGNLKKYHVVNNGIFADDAGTKRVVVEVDKKSRLQDLKDIWGGEAPSANLPVYAKYGVLAKLKLGTAKEEDKITGRNLVTDYAYDKDNGVGQNLSLSRITHEYTTADSTKTDDANRIKGLMGLLGYNISDANQDLSAVTAGMRQMGSILHSLPVLLTQEGKAVAKQEGTNVVIDTEGRQDYVLFGTTQGLLHVVDAESGEEKFAFLPKEMAEKQYELFKYNAGTWDNGKNALYYGIDGEWTAHTVYVSKADGTLTVDGVSRNVTGSTDETENLNGKQWVYGGLRMGGRSYYALDLTDMDDSADYKPTIKFHIDPDTGSIHRTATKDGAVTRLSKTYPAIAKMGQSWSKPKLDYVNWEGERKLVMFVGGGYDAGGINGDGLYNGSRVRTGYEGYEQHDYTQTNEIGSGVYMFDADNGDLLWYTSKTKHSTLADAPEGTKLYDADEHTQHDDLKFSVVSDIKTVDRNNDGIVDHLYFGDLAGQAFRVDLNKQQNNQMTFEPQVTRILNLHQTDGTSQRFYHSPMFTAHHSANGMTTSGSRNVEGGNIVMATFISGNKSSPLLGTAASEQYKTSTGLQMDGVFAVYEYDIHPTGVYYPETSTADKTLATNATTPSLTQLMPLSTIVNAKDAKTRLGATIDPQTGWGGWYYKFDKNFEEGTETAGVIKGISPLVAMEGNLYVTVYDASEEGSTETCGAGVKGQSFTQRLCLPSGVCQEQANYKYNLGSGTVGLNVGPMSNATGGNKGIIISDPTRSENMKCVGVDCPTPGNRFIAAGGALKFIPHRWYERYAVKE